MGYNVYEDRQDERAFKELVEQHRKDAPRVGRPGARRGGIIEQGELEQRVKERFAKELRAELEPLANKDGRLTFTEDGLRTLVNTAIDGKE
jgi:hypothetical protein